MPSQRRSSKTSRRRKKQRRRRSPRRSRHRSLPRKQQPNQSPITAFRGAGKIGSAFSCTAGRLPALCDALEERQGGTLLPPDGQRRPLGRRTGTGLATIAGAKRSEVGPARPKLDGAKFLLSGCPFAHPALVPREYRGAAFSAHPTGSGFRGGK